jgi:SAM-dependent methyltransferase
MTTGTNTYRWNTSEAAEAFDRAAEYIHPLYLTVQDEVLANLPFAADEAFLLVDLGAGSGRLVERVLTAYPNSYAVLIDQSEPFLAIAERRLHAFGDRATFLQCRLQFEWPAVFSREPSVPRAIVSMSAIHHLDPGEKQSLFARCYNALAPGGVFINGDEYRPESDDEYLAAMRWWCDQKNAAEASGQIPKSFTPMFEAWYDRNIRRFGEPKKSGDDCHETVAVQMEYLRAAGFVGVRMTWAEKLWAVVAARKP